MSWLPSRKRRRRRRGWPPPLASPPELQLLATFRTLLFQTCLWWIHDVLKARVQKHVEATTEFSNTHTHTKTTRIILTSNCLDVLDGDRRLCVRLAVNTSPWYPPADKAARPAATRPRRLKRSRPRGPSAPRPVGSKELRPTSANGVKLASNTKTHLRRANNMKTHRCRANKLKRIIAVDL